MGIPLRSLQRLCPEIGPESALDPRRNPSLLPRLGNPTTKAPAIRWHSEKRKQVSRSSTQWSGRLSKLPRSLGGTALTRAASVASRNCLPTSWQARHNCEASLSPLCARAGVRLDSWTARRAWHRIAEAPQAAFPSAVSSSSPCQPLTFAWYIIRKSRSERKSINVEW